jgi:N utilization substance protein B
MTNEVKITSDDEKSSVIPNTKILTAHRTKSRKLLFQELYAMSFNVFDLESFKESFFENVFRFKQDEKYINEMIKIITFYEKFFINILKIYTPKFKIETMSLSYVLPIYIWLAEMFFLTEEIPGKVSINEAVEIAKVYGDDSSKKIVNWVLNKVFNDIDELFKTKDDDYSSILGSCFKK